jgi:hypothetical protein
MHKRTLGILTGAIVLAIVVVVAIVVVAGDDDSSSGTSDQRKRPAVVIGTPKDGQTVECPVRLRLRDRDLSEGGRQVIAHAIVDAEPPAPGSSVPTADGTTVVDFRDRRARFTTMPPGAHRITVFLSDPDRRALDASLRDEVAVTVNACEPPATTTPPS